MAAQSTQLRAVSAASHYHHYSNGNNDGGHAADADPPSCVTHQPRRLSQRSSELCALQTTIAEMTTTPARTTTSAKMMTSTRITSSARTTTPAKSIAKTTLATVTVKTIATTTPDSREDNNFRKDDEPRTSTKMIAKTTPATAMVKTIATTTAPATTSQRPPTLMIQQPTKTITAMAAGVLQTLLWTMVYIYIIYV